MDIGIIYKVTNDVNGKVYIGQTTQRLAARKSAHTFRAKKGDRRSAFQIALLDEGFSNFQWEQIDTAQSEDELNAKEQYWTTYYRADDPAYGYCGTSGGKTNFTFSENTRKKISNSLRDEKNPNFGKKFSPEHCRKISKSNKGRQPTEETKRKFSKTMTGYKWSEEVLAKRKTALQSPKIRKKMSEAHKGKQTGEKNPHASITNETARQIKTDLQNGMRTVDITKKYNVGRGVVNGIKRGGWADVA